MRMISEEERNTKKKKRTFLNTILYDEWKKIPTWAFLFIAQMSFFLIDNIILKIVNKITLVPGRTKSGGCPSESFSLPFPSFRLIEGR